MKQSVAAGENDNPEVVLDREREEILGTLEDWLETPLLILGFVWLGLLETFNHVIRVIFIVDFVVKFTLAPREI